MADAWRVDCPIRFDVSVEVQLQGRGQGCICKLAMYESE